MENHHAINGKTHYKWPFSIAMLVHQRVNPMTVMMQWNFPTKGSRFHQVIVTNRNWLRLRCWKQHAETTVSNWTARVPLDMGSRDHLPPYQQDPTSTWNIMECCIHDSPTYISGRHSQIFLCAGQKGNRKWITIKTVEHDMCINITI